MQERRRRNEPERMLDELAVKNGWRPTKRGWPDFMCIDDKTGKFIAVEVKPRIAPGKRLVRLRADQATCMDHLTKHGIKCFVSDGVTLEPYCRRKHRDLDYS